MRSRARCARHIRICVRMMSEHQTNLRRDFFVRRSSCRISHKILFYNSFGRREFDVLLLFFFLRWKRLCLASLTLLNLFLPCSALSMLFILYRTLGIGSAIVSMKKTNRLMCTKQTQKKESTATGDIIFVYPVCFSLHISIHLGIIVFRISRSFLFRLNTHFITINCNHLKWIQSCEPLSVCVHTAQRQKRQKGNKMRRR